MQWITLFQKEMIENWRSFKWIWLPLVITLLAIMDPITTYYMPVILEATGGLPEGAVLDIPMPSPPEAMFMSLSQLGTLGLIVIVLSVMGTIAGERKSGVLELTLVKPVSYMNYILAKWSAYLLITSVALFISIGMSWYYTSILFGSIPFSYILLTILFFSIWHALVIAIVIFYSSISNSPGLSAALSLVTIILFTISTTIFESFLKWSPGKLSDYIHEMIVTESISSDLIITGIVTLFVSFIWITAAVIGMRKKSSII